MNSKLGIFRSVSTKRPVVTNELIPYRDSMRPPDNVPYVVDNLWEWKRPEEYPNRRFSVFASPQPHLALESDPENGKIFKVELQGQFKLCQLTKYTDARYHPDCKKEFRRRLIKLLGEKWPDAPMNEKEEVGRIFLPCLTKGEMEELFQCNKKLQEIRDQLYDAITYWSDVKILSNAREIPDDRGEIFFEPFGGYVLRKVQ